MRKSKEIDIAAEMMSHVKSKHATQAGAARYWGCTPAFVNAVVHGKKVPSPKMLADAGFRKLDTVHRYERVKK